MSRTGTLTRALIHISGGASIVHPGPSAGEVSSVTSPVNSTASTLSISNVPVGIKHGTLPLAPSCLLPGTSGLNALRSTCVPAVRGRPGT